MFLWFSLFNSTIAHEVEYFCSIDFISSAGTRKKRLQKTKFWGFIFFVTSTLPTMEKVAQFYRPLTFHGNTYHIPLCIAYTQTHIFVYYTNMYRYIYVSHISLHLHRLGTLWWGHNSAKNAPGSSGHKLEHKTIKALWKQHNGLTVTMTPGRKQREGTIPCSTQHP